MERSYETMLIIRPDLTQEEKEKVFEKLKKKITDLGGKIFEAKIWAERNFAYPLRLRGAEKKKFNRGIYYLLRFSLNVKKLPDFKETVRLEESILRSLIIRRDG
ncbi:MAG: 30S ribosomal protein S6 [Candidatus Omnitrophica bacterium 4484_70.1]|nr:MAG: 30S ribosomal protein S6 [Candidatus Omnitrophica bacterium 4484_70.1]